jgi:hypothetical protein
MNQFSFISHVTHKTYLAVFGAVFVIAISFALYTNHAWEDYYIAYRSAKNLATGHGLVFSPGERVQSFSSPLNVLVLAILNVITGNTSDVLVLWLFRIITCCALGGAAVLLLRIALESSLESLPTIVLLGMFGFNAKIIDYSINGQETAFMMLFLALTLYGILAPSRSPTLILGVAWAGLMWTRPDSIMYIGGLAFGSLLFNKNIPIAKSRIELLKIFLWAGAVTTVLYLPWFIWAWYYYGSPIPHTVVAKGLALPTHHPSELLKNILIFPYYTFIQQTSLEATFVPANAAFFGGWHYSISLYSRYLAWICAFYWVCPYCRSRNRIVSFAFMFAHFCLTHVIVLYASWYITSCTFLGIFVIAHIVQDGLNFANSLKDKIIRVKTSGQLIITIRVLAELVLVTNLLLTLGSAYQLHIHQKVIEDGHRKQIGLWLRQNATSPNDTVFVEPLGYIGYFSQLKMYDFPGLSSPEVVAARKKLGVNDWAALILELQPDWVVLRPFQAQRIYKDNQLLLTQQYSLVKVFDVSEQIQSYYWLPGRIFFMYDHAFMIFRRNENRNET